MAVTANKSKSSAQKSQPAQPVPQPADQSKRKRINFAYAAPEAQNVSLVGDFNNWDYTKSMKKDKDGVWRARMDLKPGRYEYRYLVDGQWQNDPKCQSLQPNSFGTYNCVVEVPN